MPAALLGKTNKIQPEPSILNGYDLVARLRPGRITRARPSVGSMSDTSGSSSPVGAGTSGLLVYLDNTRMGGLSALSDIPTTAIGSIQFMDVATAGALLPGLGSSFITGAIVVHSRKRPVVR